MENSSSRNTVRPSFKVSWNQSLGSMGYDDDVMEVVGATKYVHKYTTKVDRPAEINDEIRRNCKVVSTQGRVLAQARFTGLNTDDTNKANGIRQAHRTVEFR